MILDISPCADSGTLQAIYIIKWIIKIICILAPIILIVTSIVALFKSITSNDSIKESVKKIIVKFIICTFIFFIPSIITTIIAFINNGKESENYLSCYDSATIENIEKYKEKEKEELEKEKAERKKKQEENERKLKEQDEKRKKDAEDTTKRNQQNSGSGGGISSDNYVIRLSQMSTPSISTLKSAASSLGISEEYLIIIIGTTYNEDYGDDPYLYYGWASAMINQQVTLEQMEGWGGDFYSWSHIVEGYNAASDNVLKSVYLAMTERNTKIVECDGMYETTPDFYNLLYSSPYYNCSIYETK